MMMRVSRLTFCFHGQAALEVYTHISAAPKNVIVMWGGSAGTTPSGWVLCDGANGTPDLRDKFVVGAGGNFAAGSSTGDQNQTTGGVFGFDRCVLHAAASFFFVEVLRSSCTVV